MSVRRPYVPRREDGLSMADNVARRVDREGRPFHCAGCSRKELSEGRAPMGWLRLSALVEGQDGHTDDWSLLALCCSTACLVAVVAQLDAQAKEAIGV